MPLVLSSMPPQQSDNEEADGAGSDDDVTVRVVQQGKGKGAGDDAVGVSPAVGVEDAAEAELRATKEMAHYCFGEHCGL